MSCPECGHLDDHDPSCFGRADGPVGCDSCTTCEGRRVQMRLPTTFRVAHLLLLQCADDLAGDLADDLASGAVSFQALARRFSAVAAASGLMGGGTRAQWGDPEWLVHDLEDWELVHLHRARATPLAAASRGEHLYVAGVALSRSGRDALEVLGDWLRTRMPQHRGD